MTKQIKKSRAGIRLNYEATDALMKLKELTGLNPGQLCSKGVLMLLKKMEKDPAIYFEKEE